VLCGKQIFNLLALFWPCFGPALNPSIFSSADLIWTSGENFKFDQTGSDRCDSPTLLSGDNRLSLGMLDLSGASDPNFGSDCGTEERLDASAISPHNTVHSANTTVQCTDHNVSTSSDAPMCAAQSNHKTKMANGPSPGRILDSSNLSVGHNSFNLSQMPTVAAIKDLRPNLNVSGSPLHPQRLFNPGANGVGGGLFPIAAPAQTSSMQIQQNQQLNQDAIPCATPIETARAQPRGSSKKKGAYDESNDLLSSLERPARRLSAPIYGAHGMHASNPSPARPRFNPFLPRGFQGGSSGLTMGFFGETSIPLTVRSFLDDFCDIKEIGCGSFGRVFSCRRKIDLCQYAVKEINNEFRSERERERLLREIYALSTQGDNIHVVRYFNAWEQDDKLYIQTELCTGSLEDVRKRQGAQSEDTLREILVQIATGLAFMHAHNMAHLDGECGCVSVDSCVCVRLCLHTSAHVIFWVASKQLVYLLMMSETRQH